MMRPSHVAFAAAMIGLGVLGFVYGEASISWQPIPRSLPGRLALIDLCSAIEVAAGIALLLEPAQLLACRVLLPFLLLWLALIKLPPLVMAPQVMVNWESFAEVAVPAAGAWCLFAARAGAWERQHLGFAAGDRGIRAARLLLIVALPMIGLSHFAYHDLTASLVPKWLHVPLFWTYLTGAASLAAAAGMLFGVYPRLAANLETAMLWIITLLVWIPRVADAPSNQENWSEITISASIAAGVWLVADTYRQAGWFASGGRRQFS